MEVKCSVRVNSVESLLSISNLSDNCNTHIRIPCGVCLQEEILGAARAIITAVKEIHAKKYAETLKEIDKFMEEGK